MCSIIDMNLSLPYIIYKYLMWIRNFKLLKLSKM